MDLIVETLVETYKWVHDVLRDEVRDLTPRLLDHVPASGTSSIAALVLHTLGSEAEIWTIVAGESTTRDRAAEFVATGLTASDLIGRIDAADRLLDERAPRIGAAALAAIWNRPNRRPHTGASWLINNFGHAREHLAHLQLTKQLCPDVYPPVARPF